MAHLEVEPKRSSPWWIWLIVAIVALGIIALLARGCNNENTTLVANDSTTTDTTMTDTIARTQPDWSSVDFNGPTTSDPDITDKDITVAGNDNYTIYSLGENILFLPMVIRYLQQDSKSFLISVVLWLNVLKGLRLGFMAVPIQQDQLRIINNWVQNVQQPLKIG